MLRILLPVHRLAAYGGELCRGACTVVGLLAALAFLAHPDVPLGDPWFWLHAGLGVVAATALGWFTGAFFLWRLVGQICVAVQGWPFRIDDRVLVLRGPYADKTLRVCGVWLERGQCLVELPPGEKLPEAPAAGQAEDWPAEVIPPLDSDGTWPVSIVLPAWWAVRVARVARPSDRTARENCVAVLLALLALLGGVLAVFWDFWDLY